MIQQYMTDEEEVRITKEQPGIQKYPLVKPEELIGNFDFELVAANYATNKVVRQRNLLAFANWAAQTPYWNWPGAIEEFSKIFEIRNVYKMIKPEQQVQAEQQQQQQSQAHMMLLEKILETESKSIVAELSRKPGEQGGLDAATKHAMEVQEFLESFLQNSGGVPVEQMHQTPPGMNSDVTSAQPQRAIAGVGTKHSVRSMGQSMRSNGIGIGGNKE
jgi:hypothetical protein